MANIPDNDPRFGTLPALCKRYPGATGYWIAGKRLYIADATAADPALHRYQRIGRYWVYQERVTALPKSTRHEFTRVAL